MKRFFPLIFACLVIVFFWQFFLKGLLPIPSDTIVGLYHPWRDLYAQEYPNGIPFKNFLITDPVRQLYPWRYAAVSSLKAGSLPLWNPYNFSGSPLLANLQSAVFYPFNIFLLFLPFEYGWSFLVFLQPFLAGIFLYFYLRNLKLKSEACFLGSLAFAFGGFFAAWLEWNTILHTALWLPLILLAIDKIFSCNTQGAVKRGNSFMWSTVFIFSMVSSFFAGHLQTFFYLFIVSTTYIASHFINYPSKHRKKLFLLFTIYYLLFAFITLIQWLPTLKFILSSAREFDQASWQKEGWFVSWQHLIQFFAPDFFGNPTTLNYWGDWNYAEMVGYIGIVPLLFAVFNLVSRRDKKTLFFGTLFFASLIFTTPTWFGKLPYILKIPFISTSQPTRLLFLVDFSLAVLAALGLDHFLRNKTLMIRIIKVVISMGIVFAGLWIFVIFGKTWFNSEEWLINIATAKRNLILPTLIFFYSAFALIISSIVRNKSLKKLLLLSILAVVVFDLFRFSWKFNPFTKKAYLFPDTEITKFLQNQKQPFRIMTADKRIFPPNFSAVYKIQTIDGYDPLYLENYGQFASAWIRGKPDISDFSFNRIVNIQNFESRFADLLNVKYILSLDELTSEKLTKVFEEGQTKVYENKNVFPRAFFAQELIAVDNQQEMINAMFDEKIDLRKTAIVYESDGIDLGGDILGRDEKVEIVKYEENKVYIQTKSDKERLLILSDTHYPSWKAYVSGQEKSIYEVDYILRGVVIPEGEHEITFIAKVI